MSYRAPLNDIFFALDHVANLPGHIESGIYGDLDRDTVSAIVEEAAHFANNVLAPTNRMGDQQGVRLVDGNVILPDVFKSTYRQFVEGGWCGLSAPEEYGGQNLPVLLASAVKEIWNSANMAFGLAPFLTQSGVNALAAHGSETLKQAYLPKLVSGEWTATMLLTEPQAGSDLRFLQTRAMPTGDGTYKITGTKIYITYGEHSLTDNIIHLILARLPDAPPGTKGISLFLVPKFLVHDNNSLGPRNDVICTKLEHKLGIHASPTCVMNFGDRGGATGYLVGEPNKGLYAMLTMMNHARISVGVQGVGIAERAYQQALLYAQDRKQGTIDGTVSNASVPIIAHPDVKRMLLTMKAKTAGARALYYVTAAALDMAHRSPHDAERKQAEANLALLTPVAKAFSTDIGVEVASDGIQVHGGMGYIEETGAAQHLRDARIAPIYEGTNGIQAIDLVTRKITMNKGQDLDRFIDSIKRHTDDIQNSTDSVFIEIGERLQASIAALDETSQWLLQTLPENKNAALAGATPYLRLFGLTVGGVHLAKGALSATKTTNDTSNHTTLAHYYADSILSEVAGLKHTVTHAHAALSKADTIFGS